MMPLEKLTFLEQQVTQMVGLIKQLQTAKRSLEDQVTQLGNQVQSLSQDLDNERNKVTSFTQVQEENQRFQEERGQVYAKIESMLNGLEGLEI